MADPSKAQSAKNWTIGLTLTTVVMLVLGILILTLVISSQADSSDSTNSSDGENNSCGCTQDQYYLWWQVVALVLIGATVLPAVFAGKNAKNAEYYTYAPSSTRASIDFTDLY